MGSLARREDRPDGGEQRPGGPVHIVHVTHRAWPVPGGSERHVHEIARRQVLTEHRVTVVATDADDLAALWDRCGRRVGPKAATEHQGVQIRRLPVRCLPAGRVAFPILRRLTWLVSRFSDRAALSLSRFSPWVPDLPRVLREERAEILFAWNLTLEGLTSAVAGEASRSGVPWVAVPLLHLGQPRFYTMRHQLALLRRADAVVAQTSVDQAFLIERGIPAGRVRIAGPGVNLEDAQGANGDRFRRQHSLTGPLVLGLGALSFDKGTRHLIAAAQRAQQSPTLVLAGPDPQGIGRRLGEGASCRYLGLVSEQEKWDAIAAADVVALPSRTESFGIVFLEAWAQGKPVIGVRAGGVPEVIEDGVDGLLVPFGDVGELAAALDRLVGDPRSADEMGRRGQEKVRRLYTWDRQAARLGELLDAIARERELI